MLISASNEQEFYYEIFIMQILLRKMDLYNENRSWLINMVNI